MELPLIGRRNYLNPIQEFSTEFNVNQTIEVTQKLYYVISALWAVSHLLVGEYRCDS